MVLDGQQAELITPSSTPEPDPSLDRTYHSKRPHKKSRTGCTNCKARKVKCDEGRPSCRSCTLRKTPCVYTSRRPTTAVPCSPCSAVSSSSNGAVASPRSRALTQSPVVVQEPLFRPSPSIDEVDMKLLWFYTANTSYSFAIESTKQKPVENIMRNVLVQQAFETPFLMDSLFSLSSLHLKNLNQDHDRDRALLYRARSFEGYRKAIDEAKPETFRALLANSLLLTAISSEAFRDPEGPNLYILEWMIVWRGISLIFDMISPPGESKFGLAALFYRPTLDLELAAGAIPNSLLFLVSSMKEDDPEFSHASAYYHALKYLGSLYLNLKNGLNPVMRLRIITWLTFLPQKFIQLGQERQPRALVILAHYAIFLKLLQDTWWYKDIGSRTLRDIITYLDPIWKPHLNVPLMALEVRDEVTLGRILLADETWEYPSMQDIDHVDLQNLTLVDDEGKRVVHQEGHGYIYIDEEDTNIVC